MSKPAVIESVTTFTIQGLRCRVWRNEDRLEGYYDNCDLKQAALELGPARTTVALLAELLAKRARVNAVEVVDQDGDGVKLKTERSQ